MKRILIGILVASAFVAPVVANAGEYGSGSGGTPTNTTTATATSNANGGAGGTGGTASGGTAAGGTASNTISGTYGASATNGGSATGGSGTGGNSNVSVSVSLPGSGTSGSGSGSGSGTTSGAGTGSSSAAGEPGSSANNTKATVDYGGTYTVKTVPNIVAPSLTTTLSDTCMGSASFGLSFTGFGATGGTTMVDQACVRRLDSREFRAMGLNDVALALLCQSEANRKAVESTGRSCPGMERAAAPGAPAAPVPPSAASTGVIGQNNINNIGDQYKDPVIRARLGLDKLPDLSQLKDR
ncbi:hypothetical protein SAMN04515618_110115 [Collimonas sp. OK307]|uniref:hypothetical protein n=1 Tax=Collimonas sp. OK307 TaxID=1801620 RepID=UPI0008EECAB9|nr:hypothetical protein [Collimonas sp. OK307]SFI11139.1 hypothetical protein SAMN04515618_110115 [Collimonas sp. OK307]